MTSASAGFSCEQLRDRLQCFNLRCKGSKEELQKRWDAFCNDDKLQDDKDEIEKDEEEEEEEESEAKKPKTDSAEQATPSSRLAKQLSNGFGKRAIPAKRSKKDDRKEVAEETASPAKAKNRKTDSADQRISSSCPVTGAVVARASEERTSEEPTIDARAEASGSSMPAASSTFNPQLCASRVWGGGSGGRRLLQKTSIDGDYCRRHQNDFDQRGLKHGHIDGDIPPEKKQEFERYMLPKDRSVKDKVDRKELPEDGLDTSETPSSTEAHRKVTGRDTSKRTRGVGQGEPPAVEARTGTQQKKRPRPTPPDSLQVSGYALHNSNRGVSIHLTPDECLQVGGHAIHVRDLCRRAADVVIKLADIVDAEEYRLYTEKIATLLPRED